jgi:hypothetical protein
LIEIRFIEKGKNKFAYVEFETDEAARAALALNGTKLDNNTVKAAISNKPANTHISKSLG